MVVCKSNAIKGIQVGIMGFGLRSTRLSASPADVFTREKKLDVDDGIKSMSWNVSFDEFMRRHDH